MWDVTGKPRRGARRPSGRWGCFEPADWTAHWITASRWFVPPALRPEGLVTPPSNSREMYAWADVDLGAPRTVDAVQLYSPAGGSFPVRFKIEGSDTVDFDRAQIIADWTGSDYHLAGGGPQDLPAHGIRARYVRLTITRSPETAPGSGNYRSVVRQMTVLSGGRNVALMRPTREFGTDWNSGPRHVHGGRHAFEPRRRHLSERRDFDHRCTSVTQVFSSGSLRPARDSVRGRAGNGRCHD